MGRFALLQVPRDAAPLAAFRIIFGALMAFEAFSSYLHKIPQHYAPGVVHFTYPGFHWVVPPPGIGIFLVVLLMGVSAFCITIGYRYRAAAITFFVLYTYMFLIERAVYNNHYYLIILLGFLFAITDAHKDAAIDAVRMSPERRGWVPAWQIYLFRAQIVVVYFFGGVAKLSPDWLQRQPLTHWLHERAGGLAIGPLLQLDIMPYFFSYGGLVFDLTIGPLLLWKRTRPLAIVLLFGFHLTNAYLFSIGVFPWLGIGAILLFLEGTTVRKLLHRLGYTGSRADVPPAYDPGRWRGRAAVAFCAIYLALQAAIPLRHWCYPGEVNWTEEGHDFSWHMKLRDKEGRIRFTVVDRTTGRREVLDGTKLAAELNAVQLRGVSCKPLMTAQYARHLSDTYTAMGFSNPAVYAEALVSLNGRPYQPIVDPAADLSTAETRLFRPSGWILPLDPDARPGLYPEPPAWRQGN